MKKILIVEDDKKLNYLIKKILEKNSFIVHGVYSPFEAFDLMVKNSYSLIISDIMMEDMDGFEFVKMLRKDEPNIPVLFITAKGEFEDKKKAFSLGVDDYMVKPIDINELVLRVNALLKRALISQERKIEIGDTILNEDSLTCTVKGENITLPLKEFKILFHLLSYPNKIFTRTQILNDCWGLYSESFDRTIDVHITHLREKFNDNKDFKIVTVRGLGYKAVINEREDKKAE